MVKKLNPAALQKINLKNDYVFFMKRKNSNLISYFLSFPLERESTRKNNIIQHYCTVPMLSIKYLVMHKVQVHNKAISYLVYGSCICTGDYPLTEARGLSSRIDG